MKPEMLIKGLLPVCRECRATLGEEPDKCGRLQQCKAIFAAGVEWGAKAEREGKVEQEEKR